MGLWLHIPFFIGDVPTAGAILDRFLQHDEIIAMKGRSYRLMDKSGKGKKGTGQ